MKVLFLDLPLKFSLIPRKYIESSENFVLYLRNEMTGLELTPEFSVLITDKIQITLLEQPEDFKNHNKYEIELKNNNEILYWGKLITLNQGTDVQNYTYGNSKFSFRE